MTRAAFTAGCVLALAALAAGCGGGSTTTTTSAASTATTTSSAARTTTSHTRAAATTTTTSSRSSRSTSTTSSTTSSAAATTTTTTTTTPVASATTTTTTTTTRTETGPAFVGGGSPTGALAAADAVLARHGYATVSSATYGAPDTLHVLIGRAPAGGERAFFFNERHFIGTDSPETSARIVVVAHGDSDVTLAYDVYAAGAPTPSGQRRVNFALDMGQLSALGPLPSVAERR